MDKLDNYLNEKDIPSTIQIGSCNQHILHGALKTAMNQSAWSVDKILKALYWILHDSPARRDIYASEGGGSVFPLRFVKWVWFENFPITNFCELFQGPWHVIKSRGGKTVFLKSSNMVFLLKLNNLPKCVPVFLCVFVGLGERGSRVMRGHDSPGLYSVRLLSDLSFLF